MEKEDRIIEILAWLCIIAIIGFCIRFNYELHTNTPSDVQEFKTYSFDKA